MPTGLEEYPFEDFLRDMTEFTSRRRGGSPSFEASVVQVHSYMRETYKDPEESMGRMERFVLIMHYLAEHIEELDQGDFAVYGSRRVGALVSWHLLKAVHEIFTTRELNELGYGPPVAEILRLAERYRPSDGGLSS